MMLLNLINQTAFLSLTSTIQCWSKTEIALRLVRKIYTGASPTEVSPLMARMFGTWNLLSTVVRVYAAYDMHNRPLYVLSIWTYVIALAHFFPEIGIWGTVDWRRSVLMEATPVVSILWLVVSWKDYV